MFHWDAGKERGHLGGNNFRMAIFPALIRRNCIMRWIDKKTLDADIQCLYCAQADDVSCGTHGSETFIYKNVEVIKDVCVTVGDVELDCLDVPVACLGCIHVADGDWVKDGVVALWCLEVLIGCLLCPQVDDGDWITNGLVGFLGQRFHLVIMGSQHSSPNVKTICNLEPQIWLEIITSRDAENVCFKGSRTSCWCDHV